MFKKLSRSQIVVIGVLVAVLALVAFIVYERVSPNGIFAGLKNDLKEIQPESVTYTDLEGNIVDLAEFKGKPLIINSWATWIPFSKDELKLLEKTKETYGDKIVILAINRKEDKETIKSYLRMFGISGGVVMLADSADNFYKVVKGYATPETVFYRKDGTIAGHTRGVLNEGDLIKTAEMLISN